ncbi:MAG: hypothetical protein JW841_03170 [Deltaproteobacteria bacterium]|nr:hypothetical protein [Deltaproteobacteria bacterium]
MGRVYIYQVRSYRQVAAEDCFSTPTDALSVTTPPVALIDISITPAGPDILQLVLTDTNQGTVQYQIERRQGTDAFTERGPLLVTTLSDAAQPIFLDAVTPGESYDYRVAVVNESGTSDWLPRNATASTAPVLTWSGTTPELTPVCSLHLSGSASFDDTWRGSFQSASAVVDGATTTSATASGLYATLTDLNERTFTATWTVNDNLGGSTSLTQNLNLSV